MSINPKMLTVEDVNSIIIHFGRGFCDYYTLDTRLLTTQDTWFAYDFIDVYRTDGVIQLKVNNGLWTRGYYIEDVNIIDYDVSVFDDNITITGDGLEWCVIVLELSPEFQYQDYLELEFKPEYLPVIRPFYEDIDLVVGAMTSITDEPIEGKLFVDTVTGEEYTTDEEGLIAVISSINKAGDYDEQLQTSNSMETVNYNFPYIRLKSELPVRLVNDTVYRDKTNLLTFEFLFDDTYNITQEMLFNNNDLILIVDNVEYEITSFNENQFSVVVPIGSRNELTMKLQVGGNDYINNYDLTFTVDCEFISFDNASALKEEIESELSASVVEFTGTELDTVININKNVLIRFTNVVWSDNNHVFVVSDDATLKLHDCNFTGKTLALLDDGNIHCDVCILQQSTDTLIKGKGNVILKDCSFIDNLSCVNVKGELNIKDTLFDLSDSSYYDATTPAFITVYGEMNIDFCQFNINLTELTTLGLGYVLFLIGKDSTVNGVTANELMQNEMFPTRKNTASVDVKSTNYHIQSKNNKCMVWNIENTNTVYSNQLIVEYLEEE